MNSGPGVINLWKSVTILPAELSDPIQIMKFTSMSVLGKIRHMVHILMESP